MLASFPLPAGFKGLIISLKMLLISCSLVLGGMFKFGRPLLCSLSLLEVALGGTIAE